MEVKTHRLKRDRPFAAEFPVFRMVAVLPLVACRLPHITAAFRLTPVAR